MSIEALKWAWEQDCPNPTAKLVLMALADHSNSDGECWPSMKRIAEISGISARQVSTHIADLARLGLVTKADRRRRDGQYRGWDYVVNFQRKSATSGSVLPVTSGSTASSPAEVGFRSEPSVNHQVEPLAAAPRERAPRPKDELFEAMVSEIGVNPATLTGSERGRINKALKELREVGATPEELRGRAAAYRAKFPDVVVTATALSANWSMLVSKRTAKKDLCENCGQRLDRHDQDTCDAFGRA